MKNWKLKRNQYWNFLFQNELLFEGLKEIKNNNAQNEYYLTDLVEIFNKKGLSVNAMVVDDVDETMGVNDRVDLRKHRSG